MSNELDESVSNYDWIKQEIAAAQSRDRLDLLAQNIAYDKWEGAEWTRDEDAIKELRKLWQVRADEIKGAG